MLNLCSVLIPSKVLYVQHMIVQHAQPQRGSLGQCPPLACCLIAAD